MAKLPDYKTLYVDPGEDTGWAVARGHILLAAGTEKMWLFADDVFAAVARGDGVLMDPESIYVREGMGKHFELPIKRIVCEDWRLYPEKLKSLAWDQCRTARLIGALTMICRVFDLEWKLQPASIKPEAVRAGVEEFYYRPLKENRHQNDALQHWLYDVTYEGEMNERTPSNVSNKERDSS